MASEAITQNDLREILSRTVGSIPSEYKKLLWSNPNPTANFPTQALLNGEDLTVYDAIEVIGINYSGYKSIMPPLQIPIGGKGNLIGLAGSTGDSAGMGFLVMRGISVNTNSIVVSGAMGVSTNGASWSANDNNMIPQKIYGIKYERVAPPQVDASDYVVEQGANYRKWNSGRLEQWGVETNASSANHSVSFPTPFISTDYVVVGSNTSGTQANFMVANSNASYFYVYPSASTRLYWIAYGRWK